MSKLLITFENVRDWFPAPVTENMLAGEPWWQLQNLGLFMAMQLLRLMPPGEGQQLALFELRHVINMATSAVEQPPDEEIQRRLAQTLAPYVSSAPSAIQAMLDLADLQPGEWLLDIGSGDGRIVFEAAKRGAVAWGIEIDQELVTLSRVRCREQSCARFVHGDALTLDWSTPDVVTCYLVTESMNRLQEKFRALRSGTRIVSHAFGMTGWDPVRHVETAVGPVFLWVV